MSQYQFIVRLHTGKEYVDFNQEELEKFLSRRETDFKQRLDASSFRLNSLADWNERLQIELNQKTERMECLLCEINELREQITLLTSHG